MSLASVYRKDALIIFYARNPRKNDAAVDRMCASIREFGFKIPLLARSDGEVVDGHLRLKAARKLGSWPGGDTTQISVILCDEWTPQQVKAFRLMVNRSVTWADWDEELLSLELQERSPLRFSHGPLKQLPPEHTGERHVVVVERCPCTQPKDHECCRFEERPGPPPTGAVDSAYDVKDGVQRIDIHVVRSPSDTEPEEHHWAHLTTRCAGRPQ